TPGIPSPRANRCLAAVGRPAARGEPYDLPPRPGRFQDQEVWHSATGYGSGVLGARAGAPTVTAVIESVPGACTNCKTVTRRSVSRYNGPQRASTWRHCER